ncbi:hypothetical protein PPERSA_07074 [Pseudocohnilembus persalinus]|uniref:Uncharacterized protein n=1 Tax=Pseudocohnilembus persalinus TaxID=266149 RepID=A0A0V0QX70_PSEPJ|nr:hypothetical protein PPERSA_07074 [Pseudocohnilembus persalinus]|eukprot:KRX06911.1 hypothetical protein PPERSA_07074 [Pseudocohnilembus persalinus]
MVLNQIQLNTIFQMHRKVPFLGLEFDGLISTLLIGDKTYSFSSTIGSIFKDMKISGEDGNKFEIVIVDWFQRIKLYIKGDRFKQDHQFYCPTKYGMKKKVKETLDGHAEIKLTQFNYLNDQETIIVEGITKKAGIEVEW